MTSGEFSSELPGRYIGSEQPKITSWKPSLSNPWKEVVLWFWVGERVIFDLSRGQFRATGLMFIVGGVQADFVEVTAY